jgi:PAT family beta-lactamase induction signal transducer AmpG
VPDRAGGQPWPALGDRSQGQHRHFALIAFAAAFASATQDIALDAWRIEAADDTSPLEVLTALYQFGYRTASIVGGAFSLYLASRMSWPGVFGVMAVVMALMIGVTASAPDTPRPPSDGCMAIWARVK